MSYGSLRNGDSVYDIYDIYDDEAAGGRSNQMICDVITGAWGKKF